MMEGIGRCSGRPILCSNYTCSILQLNPTLLQQGIAYRRKFVGLKIFNDVNKERAL